MKVFLLLILMSFPAWAKIDHKKFTSLSKEHQVELLKAYKDFLFDYKTSLNAPGEQTTQFEFLKLIQSAYADGSNNCFYAGWPSKKIAGKCSNPARTNSTYKDQASNCGSMEMMCNPVLFGSPAICVGTRTQVQRNSAFSQCERKFKANNRTLEQIVDAVPEALANEMFATADSICTTGFQSKTAMCRKLEDKVKAIEALYEERVEEPAAEPVQEPVQEPAPGPEAVVEPAPVHQPPRVIPVAPRTQPVSDRLSQGLIEATRSISTINEVVNDPELPCPPEERTPSPPQHNHQPRATLDNNPYAPDRIICPPAPVSQHTMSEAEISALLNRYNLRIYPDANVTRTQDFRNFIFELQKFPEPLMNELLRNGAAIHLIVGSGIGVDPTFIQQGRTGSGNWNTTTYGKSWTLTAGSGGSVTFDNPELQTPTRIAINNLYNRDFRHPQSHGSTNVFLHEHAHTLDSLYGSNALSGSGAFRQLMNNPQVRAYVDRVMTPYEEGSRHEAFAELFSYYHSCAEANAQMTSRAPELAAFFRNLTSVRDFRNRAQAHPQP